MIPQVLMPPVRCHWLLPIQVLVPPLRELEAYVFEQLMRQLWRGVLIEATMGDSVAGAAAARPFPDLRRRRMTREEAAVQRWLQALQVNCLVISFYLHFLSF